ncbi:NAD(P)-binding protein [Cadophora sp. DSE1049]|nr:NAD(P)-binding protein [Cadophora sp. DSE1049]
MRNRIIVTGGSGKAGRYVIEYLLEKGHQVLNLDIAPLSGDLSGRVHTIKIDLTDSGQVFSAMNSHFRLTEPFHEPTNEPPDAVIHLAGYARNMLVPDNETFRGNTIATFNIIEASCRLGVKKIILASSVCVYGVTYAERNVNFPSFPVDELLDVNPMDVYSLTKLCGERTARTYATKFGVDIYVLRIGALIAPEEYKNRLRDYVNDVSRWKVHGWSYIDARDLGQMCNLCVTKDGLGFQVFNATNDENTTTMSTTELLAQECPNVPVTREMGEREAPISNNKIKQLLGFKEEHSWHMYYNADCHA